MGTISVVKSMVLSNQELVITFSERRSNDELVDKSCFQNEQVSLHAENCVGSLAPMRIAKFLTV
jgi:hypothetical protein